MEKATQVSPTTAFILQKWSPLSGPVSKIILIFRQLGQLLPLLLRTIPSKVPVLASPSQDAHIWLSLVSPDAVGNSFKRNQSSEFQDSLLPEGDPVPKAMLLHPPRPQRPLIQVPSPDSPSDRSVEVESKCLNSVSGFFHVP